MVAAATIRIMKIAWVTYLGALSRLNALLIPRISAHPPILAQYKVHRPWALFREGTVIMHVTMTDSQCKYMCAYAYVYTAILSVRVNAISVLNHYFM